LRIDAAVPLPVPSQDLYLELDRMKTRFAWVIALAALSVAATGCKKKNKDAAVDAGEDTTETTESTDTKDSPKAALKQNPQVVTLLKAIVEGCTVTVDSASVYSCKNKEDQALGDYIRKDRPKDLFETYASFLTSKDEKMRAAAIAEAAYTFTTLDKDGRKSNATKPVANAFLDALAKDDGTAVRLAPPAVDLGFIAGLGSRVIKVTDSVNTNARNAAYRTFMEYGRMEGFSRLQEVAKEKDFAVAALSAPRQMYEWTDAEKAQICPWAKGYLGDATNSTAAEAAYTVIKCKGEYIDALLDEGEKRVRNKQFDNPFAMTFREICFEFISGLSGQAGGSPQCKRNYAFLEKVTNDESVKAEVRGMSLWNIYYQRRDKESLALMRKYEKHKVPEIAKRAKEAITSLTTTYKLK